METNLQVRMATLTALTPGAVVARSLIDKPYAQFWSAHVQAMTPVSEKLQWVINGLQRLQTKRPQSDRVAAYYV